MKLSLIYLPVKDLEAALALYRDTVLSNLRVLTLR